ncbi:MAG: hypothetical protein ACR2GW_02530, partial [Pyrinomonadaceae bacterium]
MFSLININVRRKIRSRVPLWCALIILLCYFAQETFAVAHWSTKLDGRVRFYQTTELGVLVVGTEKSLYGVDSESGEVLWRRKNTRLDETDVAPVPGTDLLLLSYGGDKETRLEVADLVAGNTLWRSNKVRGSVMQMALEPDANMLAVVFARDARGRARENFKRRPTVHSFDLGAGRELWKYELESEVEMMPVVRGDGEDAEVSYTLD